MKIVVLDGHTLNPGDLSWTRLEQLGECVIHDRTPPENTLERAEGAEIILTNKVLLSRDAIATLAAGKLRYIGVLATGYNVVDIDAAHRSGITVTNVPAYSTESVAQMVFAHILNLTQHVCEHAASVRRGDWAAGTDFCYWNYPLVELRGCTIGLIGFGRIGRATARLAGAFGMRVLVYDVVSLSDLPQGTGQVPLEELLRESDFVSLHCPLTQGNTGLIDGERLALMKPSAFLINTSRGPLIDEPALAQALNEGRIAGAGLDVLLSEPPSPDNPLPAARNCYVTPHIAWATRAARRRLLDTVVANIKAFIAGTPVNTIYP